MGNGPSRLAPPSRAAAVQKPLVAVLDLAAEAAGLTPRELKHLTELGRGVVAREARGSFDVITNENLVDLLRAHDTTLEKCQGECETETGRLLGAEIVVTGTIAKVFGEYSVIIKAHRTSPPSLLGTHTGSCAKKKGLPQLVREVVEKLARENLTDPQPAD